MKKLFVILIVLFAISGCSNNDSAIQKMNPTLDSLREINASIINQRDSIIKEYKTFEKYGYWFNPKYFDDFYSKQGIAKIEYICDSLRNNPKLIPMDGILGGTMHFEKIDLLSSEWVIAEYNDGHTMGKAIYKYKINGDGSISFKIIKSIEGE